MNRRDYLFIIAILVVVFSYSAYAVYIENSTTNTSDKSPPKDLYYEDVVFKTNNIENPFLNTKFSEERFKEALNYFELKEVNWVIAQAKLETGYYKSGLFLKYNNLFGIYNSSTKSYYKYKHWSESIIAYKYYFQRPERYNPKKYNNYGEYLMSIKYAEDKQYINKLKRLMK